MCISLFYRKLSVFILLFSPISYVAAQEFHLKNLHVSHPYAHPTIAGSPTGAAYLTLENKGNTSDTLIKITSPAAQSVSIHSMEMTQGIMKMREIPSFTLGPKEKWDMASTDSKGRSYHLMLMKPKYPLTVGRSFPMTLRFKKAGSVTITVPVEQEQ